MTANEGIWGKRVIDVRLPKQPTHRQKAHLRCQPSKPAWNTKPPKGTIVKQFFPNQPIVVGLGTSVADPHMLASCQ
jgi:hypothetical protein